MKTNLMDAPLTGLTVLDVTHYIAGPYCTKLFADSGVDVIKIEKPGIGDGARRLRIFTNDEPPNPEKSALFLYLNTNKHSVTLNLKTREGIRIFKELVKKADILVENFRPGVMARLGLDYGTLVRINPCLVMTSISNFGQNGPYRDWVATELTLNALCGQMLLTGRRDREPLKIGLSQVQYTAGVAAAIATLAAYLQRQTSGSGQYIDVSLVEPMLNTLCNQILAYGYQGAKQPRESPSAFPMFLRTKDGWLHVAHLQMAAVIDYLGIPGTDDPKFKDPDTWLEHMGEFRELVEPWFREKGRFEAFEEGQMQGMMWAPVRAEADLLSCPQLGAREYFEDIEHPVAGWAKYPGRCFVSEQIKKPKAKPAPMLGQHTEEVLRLLGYSGGEFTRLREGGVI